MQLKQDITPTTRKSSGLVTIHLFVKLDSTVAAGIVSLPEESPHTSLKERVDHAESKGRMCDVAEIRNGSVAASKVSGKVERGLWLIPIEDRRRLGEDREGMREGFTFGQYLLLVDYTSRTIRKGKASVSKELEGIFERLGSNAEIWSSRVKKLQAKPWMERFLSASRD